MKQKQTLVGATMAALFSANVAAQAPTPGPYDSLKSTEGPDGYTIVWVKEGTPLWHVASEYVRGNDNLEDGILKTNLCDDLQVRRAVSNANNDIARTTAKVAHDAQLGDLEKAMLADTYMVKLKDGSTCDANPVYETVKQTDGLIGDGFAGLHAQNGKIPVAIPNKYFGAPLAAVPIPPTAPAQPDLPSAPGAPTPAAPSAVVNERLFPDNFVAGGVQYIAEGGAAPLGGPGLTAEARLTKKVSENGAVVVEVDHAWVAGLNYNDGSGDVTLGDADVSALYMHRVGPNARVGAGLNVDARTADVMYAGVDAATGQWTVGPEVVYQFDNGNHAVQVEGSLGWGNVNANVDVPGYNATSDGFNKGKVGVEYAARVSEKWQLGAEFDVESDTGARSTQDAGVRPWNDTRFSVGPTVQRDLGKGWSVRCEPSVSYSTDAEALSGQVEVFIRKEW